MPRREDVRDEEIAARLARGESRRKIAADLGVDESVVRRRVTRLGIGTPHVAATVTSPAPPREDAAALWERVEQVTDRDVERTRLERFADAVIPDPLPIALVTMSDQHITTRGPVQMRRMREDAELVAATPGAYAVLGGDGVDNHIKHRSAMVAAGSKVSEQWMLYDHYLEMFADKILAVISGNHDDWTRDEAGLDMVAQLTKAHRLHYSPDELILRLDHHGIPYRLGIRHQYRFNSSLNLTHTVKRWWEMGNDPWDIGVVCHHHEPAVEPFVKHGRRLWAARPGSYQVSSGHSRRYGFNLTTPTCPTFILMPHTHWVLGFGDLREAVSYLTWLREGWPDTGALFGAGAADAA